METRPIKGTATTAEEARNPKRDMLWVAAAGPGTPGSITRIGSGGNFLAYSHIAHDCDVGDHVILANAATLGGHITVGEWAVVGALCPIHHFVRIGAHAFIGGGGGNQPLTVAFLLNIAIILFGWRRTKDLKDALAAYSRAEQMAHDNAFTDHTTSLANRRELMRVLAIAAEHPESSTLLLLDLDYFKKVNDLHGHIAGDRVLKAVAETLVQKSPAGSCCARNAASSSAP